MKVKSLFLISLALGTLIALIPLVLKLRRDLSDAGGSYAIWCVGFFVATVVIESVSVVGQENAQGVGWTAAVVGYFVLTAGSANLWPLSLIVAHLRKLPPPLPALISKGF